MDTTNPALTAALVEIERHVGASGWDRPAQLFALVATEDLRRGEPELVHQLGLDRGPDAAPLTPIEQESLPDKPLDEALAGIGWPSEVSGCALAQEVIALPPDVENEVPDGPEAADFASAHPRRTEMRLVAAVLRDGQRLAAARVRPPRSEEGPAGHDALGLIIDPDLAPALCDALLDTLQADMRR